MRVCVDRDSMLLLCLGVRRVLNINNPAVSTAIYDASIN
jgi:hypothetical protein